MSKDTPELKVKHHSEGHRQREPPGISQQSLLIKGGGSLVLAWHYQLPARHTQFHTEEFVLIVVSGDWYLCI